MHRPAVLVLLALALAGCGGGKTAAPPATTTAGGTTTAPAPKPFTSVLDIAACNELEAKIQIVSQLGSSSVPVMKRAAGGACADGAFGSAFALPATLRSRPG